MGDEGLRRRATDGAVSAGALQAELSGAEGRQMRIEADLRDLRAALGTMQERIDGKFERLETRVESVRNDLGQSRLTLPDNFVTRREYQERVENIASDTQRVYKETGDKIGAVDARVQALEDRVQRVLWFVVATLVTGAVGLLFTLARAGLAVKA